MHLRPITPDDRDRLAQAFTLLSPRSRYLRFHHPLSQLSDEHLRYLTEVDGRDHAALVAEDADRPEHPGIAVARYIRIDDEPEVAEAAITVIDEYQGRGVGTLMLRHLARVAGRNGVHHLRNYVLADNRPMLDALDAVGGQRHDEGGGVYRIDVPLPPEVEVVPRSPAREALRAAAVGRLRVLLETVLPARPPET